MVSDSWLPARIQTDGRPRPLSGRSRASAVADWRALRACTGLAPGPTAYGAAIDVNPVQNPYITASGIHPAAAARFATIDRTRAAGRVPLGAIRSGDVVVRAFARIGWGWGGHWATSKDYQHFYAPGQVGSGPSAQRASPYHPQARAVPVEPGTVEEYVVRLYPFASAFRPGHRLVVELSCNEPLADAHNSVLPPAAMHVPSGRATSTRCTATPTTTPGSCCRSQGEGGDQRRT